MSEINPDAPSEANIKRLVVEELYLQANRIMGIDMETATIFVVGFVNHIAKGALLLVSDNPMAPDGVKTTKSDKAVTEKYARAHLEIGISSLTELRESGESVMHLRFE